VAVVFRCAVGTLVFLASLCCNTAPSTNGCHLTESPGQEILPPSTPLPPPKFHLRLNKMVQSHSDDVTSSL
jgi:hypothetical protein